MPKDKTANETATEGDVPQMSDVTPGKDAAQFQARSARAAAKESSEPSIDLVVPGTDKTMSVTKDYWTKHSQVLSQQGYEPAGARAE